MKSSTKKYLDELLNQLISKNKKLHIDLTRKWTKQFPKDAGIYALFEGNVLVYVGETGSIKGRMTDYLDTRHHTVRRKIGTYNFSKIKGFKAANSKLKFPKHIENKVNDWLKNKILLSYMVVDLGRKELEELIVRKYKPKYNSKGRRGE